MTVLSIPTPHGPAKAELHRRPLDQRGMRAPCGALLGPWHRQFNNPAAERGAG
ncbi:MAG: hypothetical protein JO115_15595 [Pseudonocardiales bacterium]|nr:hypothetical protein [Pseudonocardiales bacterium]